MQTETTKSAARKRYHARIAAGLCVKCGKSKPAAGNRRKCDKCHNIGNKSQIKRRNRLIAAGVCIWCLEKHVIKDSEFCDACRLKKRNQSKAKSERRRKIGVCVKCGDTNPVTKGKYMLCEVCFFKGASCNGTGSIDLWEDLQKLWYVQEGRCAYTGIALEMGNGACLDHKSPVSRFPHLRTDINNLHWVCLKINTAKSNLTHEEYLAQIAQIHSYRNIPLTAFTWCG
jgi:hypothetical protein